MSLTRVYSNYFSGDVCQKTSRQSATLCRAVVACLIVLFMTGCLPTTSDGPGVLVSQDHLLKDIVMGNARFVPQTQSQIVLTPAHDYWIKSGEAVAAHWDTLEYRWEKLGSECNFDNGPSNDCLICDYCQITNGWEEPSCVGLTVCLGWDAVVVQENFDSSAPAKQVYHYAFTEGGWACENKPEPSDPGCPNADRPLLFFPTDEGLYRIAEPYNGGKEAAAETKLFIVDDGTSRIAAYQLNHEVVDGTNYWTWSVGGTDKWFENFSSELNVTGIRIRKGECVNDPKNGRCLAPLGSAWTKPSRILFLPGYSGTVSGYGGESDLVCHDDPSGTEGFYIDLSACRTSNDASPSIVPKFVTPTYQFNPNRSNEQITWLVEFNANEGAEPITPGEKLIIEFLIQG